MKITIANLIIEYDFKISGKGQAKRLSYGVFELVDPSTKFLIRRRRALS